MSIELLERGASALGPLVEQVAFVGGATIGREELVGEVAAAADDVREFINTEIAELLDQRRFVDAVFGFLRADEVSQARATSVVLPRLRMLAGR